MHSYAGLCRFYFSPISYSTFLIYIYSSYKQDPIFIHNNNNNNNIKKDSLEIEREGVGIFNKQTVALTFPPLYSAPKKIECYYCFSVNRGAVLLALFFSDVA